MRINEAEHYPYDERELLQGAIVHNKRFGKFIRFALGFKFASASSQHVADPPAVSAVGKRDHESAGISKNIHRRLVNFPGLATYACNNGEAR